MGLFLNKEEFKEAFINKVSELYAVEFKKSNKSMQFHALAELVKVEISKDWLKTKKKLNNKNTREVYYFSMEFLMGRMFSSNIHNLSIHNIIKEGLKELKVDLNSLENEEGDAGLGNGGLGRLAACFMDSAASLSYPVHGNTIRYKEGFFIQSIINNKQEESPDYWLDKAYWEVRDEANEVIIPFFGTVNYSSVDGKQIVTYEGQEFIKAIPYDMPLVGANNKVVNTLKMWSVEAYSKTDLLNDKIKEIDRCLYPDDSTQEGKQLRLKQQYFFSAAGVVYACRKHKALHNTLTNIHEHLCFQINDTHPVMVILELMRILMDEEGLDFDTALNITTKTCAYTNHTILSEALEKWNIDLFKELLPRLFDIAVQINDMLIKQLENKPNKDNMLIINNGLIHMAHLAVVCSFSVNGVAQLHTDILQNIELKAFNDFYPNKFNNKTNGITHRRWCYHTNPELVEILNEYAPGWISKPNNLKALDSLNKDKTLQNKFSKMKKARKVALTNFIKEKQGIQIDPNSLFDIQVKRLHEYKRQLLNSLYILYVYNKLKNDSEFKQNFHPHTFIFGAKSAPSYKLAKEVIELINVISNKVNADEDTNKLLKVVFVENYNVSKAELLMPACDISEQISTASKEASGTGNMKFMMNGAITLGTLDGANVEISELVGEDNIVLFGLKADEVTQLENDNNYRIYQHDQETEEVLNLFTNGFFENNEFANLKEYLLNEDRYFVLYDFKGYRDAQAKLNELYKDKTKWLSMSIKNTANSGYFSSDRTIEEYNNDIWKLKKVKIK
ncbi:MAG: glycogen/starch/alpha-glucan family phosphorylase [bacterium]